MATLTMKFDSGGWKFNYDMLSKGGLVLGDVSHEDYSFAKDIRVVRIWINPDDSTSPNFELGTTDFKDITNNPSYLRYTALTSVPPFDIYSQNNPPGPIGLQAKFQSVHKVFGDDNDADDDFLYIDQTYLFTKKGKNPAHEPGGVLPAARMFPLIKFSYKGKKQIKSIRVDYRMNISLDLFLFSQDGIGIMDRYSMGSGFTGQDLSPKDNNLFTGESVLSKYDNDYILNNRPNKTGVFRDNEDLQTSTSDLESIFASFQKPVKRELFSYGLKNGLPGDTYDFRKGKDPDTKSTLIKTYIWPTTWDNIHQWGGYKNVRLSPSTPGAFHCCHLHWRWGRIAQDPGFWEKILIAIGNSGSTGALGDKQFNGLYVGTHYGGPLLDPLIPNQTIRFAITKSDAPSGSGKDWSADAVPSPSSKKYEEIFFVAGENSDLAPARIIENGEDIIIWKSVEVNNSSIPHYIGNEHWEPAGGSLNSTSNNTSSLQAVVGVTPKVTLPVSEFKGTIFIHGLYFAHEVENLSQNAFSNTLGKEGQVPAETTRWERNAKKF